MSIYGDHKPAGGSGDYLRLKDGDKVKLRIASQPVITVYKEGDRPRYAWTVWNRDLERAQVFAGGSSIYNQVADLVDDWGEPTEFDVTIKRTGSGMNDTEYAVVPVKESFALTDDQQAETDKLDLPKMAGGKWLSDYAIDDTLPEPRVKADGEFSEKDTPNFSS